MVGIARRLERGGITDIESLKTRYSELYKDKDYLNVISRATSNEKSVARRCKKAIDTFADV